MSLLDKSTVKVVIYPEITGYDDDGNPTRMPSKEGIEAGATMQHYGQSGMAARFADDPQIGFETEEMYRMRLPRSFKQVLGPRSEVVWDGKTWSVFGHPRVFTGSPKTAHYEYLVMRN